MAETYQEAFLNSNKGDFSKNVNIGNVKAKVFQNSEEGLKKASAQIKDNKLVAFPTETVYGLGANAFDHDAVLSIFVTKGRPLTDPIIVHVLDFNHCCPMLDLTEEEKELSEFLTNKFWPGPLTLVLKANLAVLPEILTAGTGFVGMRSPSHPLARKLIELSGKPIAAPSANLFAHVSPTTALHVFNDFWDKEVSIIDGGFSEFGFESSVVKVDVLNKSLLFLRLGSLSPESMKQSLKDSKFSAYQVHTKAIKECTKIEEKAESPGQLLKHYSPNVETFFCKIGNLSSLQKKEKTVLIDFFEGAISSRNEFLAYRDLSSTGNLKEAMHNFYDFLRWAENLENVEIICIVDVEAFLEKEFGEAVYDKIFRASAGKSL